MFLQAAEGWLGLSNWREANEELEKINPQLRTHPDVLKVRWAVCALAKNWDVGVEIGHLLVEAEPQDSFGWVNRSYALRRSSIGGLRAAYDALTPAVDRVKDTQPVAFNLACYASQLGNLDAAREWLAKAFAAAFRSGTVTRFKQQALAEPDLEPLWPEISKV